MTNGTLLEIASQRTDLSIGVGGSARDGYAFFIGRGPDHGYKLLITPNRGFAETREAAIEALETFLVEALALWEVSSKEGPLAGFLQETNDTLMTLEDVIEIAKKFRENPGLTCVSTWELFPEAVGA